MLSWLTAVVSGRQALRRSLSTSAVLLSTIGLTAALAEEAKRSELDHGRDVFTQLAQPPCAACHALVDAGASGNVGPDLDDLQPSRQEVVTAVTEGIETMPAYGATLSQDQINSVAAYVASVSRAATN